MIAPVLRPRHARELNTHKPRPRGAAVDTLERRVLLAAVVADPSFGAGDGIAAAAFAGMGGVARAAAVQGDGKIVAVGAVITDPRNTDDTDLAIARFNSDGSLDRTFAGTGMVIDDRMDIATTVAIRPGGLIFISGMQVHSGAPNPNDLAMLRYKPDGTPDVTFGDNGLLTVDLPGVEGVASPTFLADGKILFAGAGRPDGGDASALLLARLRSDGSPDRSFGGGDGVVTTAFGGPSGVVALADGRIIIGGTAGRADTGEGDFVVGRFLPDGSVDTTFGRGGADGDGRTVIDIGGHDLAMGLSQAPDGGYTVVGSTIHLGNPTNIADYALAHVTADGALDRGFGGGDGIVIFEGGLEDYVSAVQSLPDGRIVVAGNRNSADRPVGFARFLPDGRPDTSLGGTGSVKAGGDMPLDFGLTVQADGRLLVAGGTGTGAENTTFAVARFVETAPPPPPPSATYQAEAARRIGVPVQTNHRGFTGTGFADFAPRGGDSVEFTIDVPTAGQYLLAFRYANGSSTARQLQLGVDGGNVGAPTQFDPTGSWDRWDSAARAVTLSAGRHAVRLTSLVNGPNLDALTVRAVPNPLPTVTLQAESAFRQGPGFSSTHAGYTGSGYVDFRGDRDDFVEFRVEVPTAGRYILDFRYANGSRSNRPLKVTLDGLQYQSPEVFGPTGSWSTWRTVSQFAALPAGVTLVRLTATGSSGPNLDAVIVREAV